VARRNVFLDLTYPGRLSYFPRLLLWLSMDVVRLLREGAPRRIQSPKSSAIAMSLWRSELKKRLDRRPINLNRPALTSPCTGATKPEERRMTWRDAALTCGSFVLLLKARTENQLTLASRKLCSGLRLKAVLDQLNA
jgi:hypothetical protein